MKIIGIIIGALCAGGIYYFYKRGHKIRMTAAELAKKGIGGNIVESIEGELKLEDVVAFLRENVHDRKNDVPFVANAKAIEFKNLFNGEFMHDEAIFFGIYDHTTDMIRCAKVITAPSIDNKLKDVLGDMSLVILS